MDAVGLNSSLENVASCGVVIAPTVRTALASSLLVLKNSEHFHHVQVRRHFLSLFFF